MASAFTYQCPSCNGVLAFDAASGRLTCGFCGSSFDEGEVERAIPINESVEVSEADHVRTVGEFLERATWNELDAAEANALAYSCPSCGSSIIADQATVSTSCPYCGNNMIVSGIASAENMPQKMIPFSITKDEATSAMRRHFEHKWYLSRAFDASLEHIQGVYVPYHLYDMKASGRAEYIAYHEGDSNAKTHYYYGVKRAGHARFEKIPVDGSSKMPDAHMDAIALFDFGNMRDFATSYVAGYLAEVADESAQACLPRAEQRARNSFEKGLRDDVLRMEEIDGIEEVVTSETNVELTDMMTCVLPVWLMHCTWGGNQMLFAVNGESGRCVGDLPIDPKRRVVTVIASILGLLLILALVSVFILDGDSDSFIGYMIGAVVLAVIGSVFIDGYFKNQMRTAVEADDAKTSYDEKGLTITERWNTEKSYARKSKARSKLQEG